MTRQIFKSVKRFLRSLFVSTLRDERVGRGSRRLTCEALEDRRLLAIVTLNLPAGPNTVDVSPLATTFQYILNGGGPVTVNGGDTLQINGQAGNTDTVNITSGTYPGGCGVAFTEAVTGTGSLTVSAGTNNWSITSANGGSVLVANLPVTFLNVKNLTGGVGDDSFVFTTGSVTGTVAGGGQTTQDTLDYSGYGGGAVSVNLQSSTATLTGGFSGIEKLVGSANTADTLTGGNVANTWTISAANGGTVTGLTGGFTNIENLAGGTADDSFNFTTGSVTGTVAGGGQTTQDTLDYSGYGGGAVSVNLQSSTATLTGGFSGIEKLVGSANTADTLTGGNVANTWTITAIKGGTVTGLTGGFTNIENLTGGTADDSFNFTTGSVTGTVAGGGQTTQDTLDYSGYSGGAVSVNLQTGAATLTGGFTGIEKLVGSANTADTLTGANAANTWTITAANGGTVTGLTGGFTNIENLTGGTADDSFNFTTGSVTGTVAGGGQTTQDTLDYSGYGGGAVSVNLQSSTATLTGGFSGIEKLVGSANTADTLTGANVANTWTITAANGGAVTGLSGGFANIENLVGGTNTDAFVLSGGTLSGNINGGAGTDTLQGDNLANTWTITFANGGGVTGVTGGFSSIENITGGAGTDSFAISTGSVGGNLNGGGGSNTLDYSAYASAVTADLDSGAAPGIAGTVSNIQNFTGTALNDTLAVDALALGVTRTLNGAGGSNNQLTVDCKGQVTSVVAGTITFGGGYGTITYQQL